MTDTNPEFPPPGFQRPVFIVPMFVCIEAADSDAAVTLASDVAIHCNGVMRQGVDELFAMRLCESSPTTEWEWDGDVDTLPSTLEGLTIDSGSDRSATGLMHRLVTADADKMAPLRLATVLQLAQGWLQHRMAVHPGIKPIPEDSRLSPGLSSAEMLLHAFARAEAHSGAMDRPEWGDLRAAYHVACAEHPGKYGQLVEAYREVLRPTPSPTAVIVTEEVLLPAPEQEQPRAD